MKTLLLQCRKKEPKNWWRNPTKCTSVRIATKLLHPQVVWVGTFSTIQGSTPSSAMCVEKDLTVQPTLTNTWEGMRILWEIVKEIDEPEISPFGTHVEKQFSCSFKVRVLAVIHLNTQLKVHVDLVNIIFLQTEFSNTFHKYRSIKHSSKQSNKVAHKIHSI